MAIFRTVEHRTDFQVLHCLEDLRTLPFHLGLQGGIFLEHLLQDLQVFHPLTQGFVFLHHFPEQGQLGHQPLSPLGILPEVGPGRFLFNFLNPGPLFLHVQIDRNILHSPKELFSFHGPPLVDGNVGSIQKR